MTPAVEVIGMVALAVAAGVSLPLWVTRLGTPRRHRLPPRRTIGRHDSWA